MVKGSENRVRSRRGANKEREGSLNTTNSSSSLSPPAPPVSAKQVRTLVLLLTSANAPRLVGTAAFPPADGPSEGFLATGMLDPEGLR